MNNDNKITIEELKKILSDDNEFKGTDIHAIPWAMYQMLKKAANEISQLTDKFGYPIISNVEYDEPNENQRHAGVMLDIELPLYTTSEEFVTIIRSMLAIADSFSISLPTKDNFIRLSFDVMNVWTDESQEGK